jgi:hypothetical protein
MKYRTLTLLIELHEDQNTTWLWHSLGAQIFWNGIRVKIMAEGDQINNIQDQMKEDEVES